MGGLQDTNDNSVDFSRAAPNPRNTSSPANVPVELTRFCGHFILWSQGVHDAKITSTVSR
jgi:hypothetical protein